MCDFLGASLPKFLAARRALDQQLMKMMRLQEDSRVQPAPADCCRGGAGDISPPCQEPDEGTHV